MAGFFVMEAKIPIYKLLTEKGRLPEFIALNPANKEAERLDNVKKIVLRTGTRKAEFFQERLAKFKGQNAETIPNTVVPSVWNEDNHTGEYMMPGMRATLKTAVDLPENTAVPAPGELHISGDVETSHGNKLLSKIKPEHSTESVAQDIAVMLSDEENVFNVRSSLAGLFKDTNRGAAITETHQFKVDKFTLDEVSEYVLSLSRAQLERAPAGILWPHPLIISRIREIDGVGREDAAFEQKMISLLGALLNIPDSIDLLVRYLDKTPLLKPMTADGNLHKYLVSSSEKSPLGHGEVMVGNWTEIIPLPNGELLEMSSVAPDDYEPISALAENNFRHAPNYSYLQEADKGEELQKFITANSPANIEELCQTSPQLCNLVVKINDEVVGYRVVRKKTAEDATVIADGRRMHVALGKDGAGIGSILLARSEQIARQQGCEIMEIHATGSSHEWFLRKGYRLRDQVENKRGVFSDKPSVFFLMVKNMSEVN